jgi:hypothetical protein
MKAAPLKVAEGGSSSAVPGGSRAVRGRKRCPAGGKVRWVAPKRRTPGAGSRGQHVFVSVTPMAAIAGRPMGPHRAYRLGCNAIPPDASASSHMLACSMGGSIREHAVSVPLLLPSQTG